MKKVIKLLKQDLEQFKHTFEKQIKDQSIPLDDRWDWFVLAVKSGVYYKKDSAALGINSIECHPKFASWYDDFYIERHEIVDLIELVEKIEEKIDFVKDPGIDWITEYFLTEEDLPKIKEEILQLGYSHFVMDW